MIGNFMNFKHFYRLAVVALGLMTLTACAYRTNMQQGQALAQSQINAIHHGMTRGMVEDRLGTPLLENPYNPKKMIYLFTMLPVHGKAYKKELILTMQHDRVVDISTIGY